MDSARTTRGVIPRWEPHEAHRFTKPYSRRPGKSEWSDEGGLLKGYAPKRAAAQTDGAEE